MDSILVALAFKLALLVVPFGTPSGALLLTQANLPGHGPVMSHIAPGTPFGEASGSALLGQAGLPGGALLK